MVLMGSLRSVTSQMWRDLSLPPVARYLLLGEMATVLTDPSWGLKVDRIWKFVFQIFSLPSHPTEAKYGSKVTLLQVLSKGEYLTWETHSVWLLVSLVNLQSARVFQSLMALSAPEEMICLLSGEKQQVKTSLVCPTNRLVATPVLRSHNLRVLSQEEEIKKLLSWEREMSDTKWLCPVSYL